MRNRKKLLSILLALAMSLYALPTVWAEELTQQIQDAPENSYTDTVVTVPPQIEDADIDSTVTVSSQTEDTNTDNIETTPPQTEDSNTGNTETTPPQTEDSNTGNTETTPPQTEDTNTDSTESAPPQNDENTAFNENDISVMSLLPLKTVRSDVTIDRSSGIPAGLEDKPRYSFFVREALTDILREKGIISGSESYSGIIMYSPNDDDYKAVGWNDIIECNYRYSYPYFILGDDQLNINNVRYHVYIEYNFISDVIKNSTFNVYNKDREAINIYGDSISNDIYTYGPNENAFYADYTVSANELGENEIPGFLITLPNGHSASDIEIYEGLIYSADELDSSVNVNIASKVISDGANKEPYKLDSYDYPDNYSGSRSCYKDLTFVITNENGDKNYFPVKYNVTIAENHILLDLYPYYSSRYVRFADDLENNVYINVAKANNFNSLNVYAHAYYYDYIDEDFDGDGKYDSSKIDFACFGYYNSKEAALQAGETDIKDELFTYSGKNIDFSKCKNKTAYLSNNTEIKVKMIQVTAFDTYGMVHHGTEFLGIDGTSASEYVPSLSDDTYFNVRGANKDNNRGNKSYLDDYIVHSSDDSYFKNGYQTVFILDSNRPVTENIIYPTFTNSNGARIYIGNDVAQESDTTPLQTSGESPIKFESGKAIQYSAASESGTHLKNYWVTFVTQQRGPKLFVNATNNSDHYSDSGKPQREVFLNSRYGYHHDIFFANIGDSELNGINASLSGDTKGVKLDDYWTVTDSSVKKLAPFTKTYEPDNIAKVRLVPENEDMFGSISGTLNISTANGGSVDIELTGIAGTPKIVTDTLYDGVKYVPYSCVIMTNSMYESDAMQFSISSGALPAGIELRPNGEIYGIPTETGEFTFDVQAKYVGNKEFDSPEYTVVHQYTLVIKDNTDENVNSVNEDVQGYMLTKRVSRDIKVYYSRENGGIPVVDKIEMDSDIFWSEGSYSNEFLAFYIDGEKLAEGVDYIAEDGSTKITVRSQTFGHISMTGNDIPHTLAAEFRTDGKTKDLKRSAQNVYLDYIYNSNPDVIPDVSDGNTSSSASGNTNMSVFDSDKVNGSVNVVMTIVDASGVPISDLSVELHSSPVYSKTDVSGSAKFDSVEFGRHKLYITDPISNKKVSKSFTILSGLDTNIRGNVITAANGEKINLKIEFDGKKLNFISVLTDVSSDAGINEDGTLFWDNYRPIASAGKKAIVFAASSTAAFLIVLLAKKKYQKRL